jgi:hypothetical protein
MPRAFIAEEETPSAPRGGGLQGGVGGRGGGGSTFGEDTGAQGVARRYSAVAPKIKELFQELENSDDKATVFTLLRGTSIKASELSLGPGHCLDFTTLGVYHKKSWT